MKTINPKILGDLAIGEVVACYDSAASRNVEYVVLLQHDNQTRVLDKDTNGIKDLDKNTKYNNKRSVKTK